MKNKILIFIFPFLISSCAPLGKLVGGKNAGDPNDPAFLENIQTLKSAYRDGNVKALEEKIPAEFWSDLKQENLIEQKAEVPA